MAQTWHSRQSEKFLLGLSFGIAALLEVMVLTALAWHSTQAPVSHAVSPAEAIEAQIIERPPEESHLAEVKPKASRPAVPERVLSKAVGVGKVVPVDKAAEAPVENQTVAATASIVSHGPIVISSSSPKVPGYLRDQNFKASVLIEFIIGADASVTPHLIASSGNDELDAIALASAREWKFSPAIQANQAVASKVRLRINFEVQ